MTLEKSSPSFKSPHSNTPREYESTYGRINRSAKIAEKVYQWIGLFVSEQTTILLVDHNVRRVVKMSTHIYVLSLHEIIAQDAPETFAGDLHEQVKAWLGINF